MTAPSVTRGNYVLLTADTLHLLVAQEEVGPTEHLECALDACEETGLLKYPGNDDERRFAALSGGMTLLPHCPPRRFLATSVGKEGLHWCWDEIQILIDVELELHPLPRVLHSPNTPVDQYVEFDGKVAFLCSAERLSSFALAAV